VQDIAIYGAGGFGREMALMIQQINGFSYKWNMIGFFDDGLVRNSRIDDKVVLGGIDEAQKWNTPLSVVLAIADPGIRSKIVEQLVNQKLSFPALIHPSCNIGDEQRNRFGKGILLTANVVLTTNVILEDFVIINLATTIGHDVTIGACSSIMPGCSISGNVEMGARTLVGTGVKFLQNITLGDDCVVGAGAVVTKSFGHGFKLVGVPAKGI
jgi:sugar O-acyltransferase (sialic acid O-acetyltransferase NeuD family)